MFLNSGVEKNIEIHQKLLTNRANSWKSMGIYENSQNLFEKDSKSEPEGAKGSQKGTTRCQKWTKREPTGAHSEWATWSPKGAKSEPRGNQNASKNRSSEKVAKSPTIFIFVGSLLGVISIKNIIENSFKNR